ncbi:MAG: L-arabinose isomerase, partial [Bacteroidota bacterium]|nr:L-arabinose isomerase [Bacteroidota bacterium]
RTLKVMALGLDGGTSFMEDYTYHFHPQGMKALGAHMLEVCPSIAEKKPSLEVHPLGIGGKDDPARLVFNVGAGPAINVSLIDMGNRFRLIVNDVDVVAPEQNLPKLPVARVVLSPLPDLPTAAAAWIYAGGAHHTVFSKALTNAHLYDFAEIAGLEHLSIGRNTCVKAFKKELKWNDVYYHLANGLKF